MFANVTGWHFLIIVLVILLLFGATRLPALAKSVGQSAKIFRREMKEVADPDTSGAENDVDASTQSAAGEPVGVAVAVPDSSGKR